MARFLPAIALAIALGGCGQPVAVPPQPQPQPAIPATRAATPIAAEQVAPPTEATLGEFVVFPTIGVKIRQPPGFVKETTFDGFGQEELQSSIMAVSIPGPFAEVSAGFNKENLASRGLALLARGDVQVGKQPGILVHFEQTAAGIEFQKWALIFGDEQKTTLVTATYPKDRASALSMTLKAAVLSTQPDSSQLADPAADLPFTLGPPDKLKLATGLPRTLIYTLDGKLGGDKSPENPLFIAAPSLGKFASIFSSQETAQRRLQATAETKNLEIISHEPVTMDGLEGFESLADAEDKATGTPIVVYQVMLFSDESYIVMTGMVGKARADEFLPEFKQLAHSLKRKPAGD